MNIGLITARIIKKPIRFSNFNQYFTEIEIIFLHSRNYFARAIALANGEIGQSIFDIYHKGDSILIEGEYLSFEDASKNTHLVIYITEANPAHLIIRN